MGTVKQDINLYLRLYNKSFHPTDWECGLGLEDFKLRRLKRYKQVVLCVQKFNEYLNNEVKIALYWNRMLRQWA